jgi:hypothetical protein
MRLRLLFGSRQPAKKMYMQRGDQSIISWYLLPVPAVRDALVAELG